MSTCRRTFLGIVILLAHWQVEGATITVREGGDLQAAINSAQSGDVILLQQGAVFIGNFTLPAKSGSDYITIRSAAADAVLPGATTRMTPAIAGLLPKIKSGNPMAALTTAPGAHHWRLMFLEFQGNTGGFGNIIELGDVNEASRARVPHHITIDRCYIHGDPAEGQKRGIALNSASSDVLNSYISDIKAIGQDSQGIGGWNGPGPYRIENNYVEAAGENIMFGGADPKIPNLIPTDILIRRNHLFKPPSWRDSQWSVKNLFELKNARRVTIEYNLMENNWISSQTGYAVLFTPRNQDGGAPWTVVQDVVFRHNVVRHSSSVFNILGVDGNSPSEVTERISITNNLFYDIGAEAWGGNGVFLLIGDGPANVVIAHNTIVHSGNIVTAWGESKGTPITSPGFVYRDNLAQHNEYGIFGVNRAFGNDTIKIYFPDSVIRRNVIAGGVASRYPGDNFFPAAEDFLRLFVNAANGDFRLASGSRYTNAASDGAAIGADQQELRAAFAAAGVSNTLPPAPTSFRIVGDAR
jgi:hypothetical protein